MISAGSDPQTTVIELRHTGRRLSFVGLISLGIIAALVLTTQTGLFLLLAHGQSDATLINTAGRQRMLSQRVASKAATAAKLQVNGEFEKAAIAFAQLNEAAEEILHSHVALSERDPDRNLDGVNSPEVQERLDELGVDLQIILRDIASLQTLHNDTATPDQHNDIDATSAMLVQEIQLAADHFLPRMHEVVGMYEAEALQHQSTINMLLLIVGGLQLVVLSILGLGVIRPATRSLTHSTDKVSDVVIKLRDTELESARLAVFARRSTNAMVRTDGKGRIVWVNDGFTRISGYTLDEVVGQKPGAVLQCERTDPKTVAKIREAIKKHENFYGRLLNRAKDGREYWLELEIMPESNDEGQLVGFIAIESDITELVETAERAQNLAATLRDAHQRFELSLAGSRDAIFDWDLEQNEVYYAPRWSELLRCQVHDLDQTIHTLLGRVASSDLPRLENELNRFIREGDKSIESEFRLMADDGSVRWILLRAAAIRGTDGTAQRVSGSVADVSGLKAVEEQMRLMVERDQLTGLASRTKFLERLEQALARNRRSGTYCAVLFIDFDRFKVINDTLGHDVGDELLKSIAVRLRENTREIDTQARFGGDEFVILIEDLADSDTACRVAEKLLEACAEPHLIRGHRLVSTASIGLVTTEFVADGASALLRDADAAMYQAKANGRGCVVVFDKAMHEASLARFALEEELRDAISNNQLSLWYQPILKLDTGEVVGAEALVRWRHPGKGMISPAEFISIAEESNQIMELGAWVITEACRQITKWKQSGIAEEGFCISINLSKVQLMTPGFTQQLCNIVSEAGLEPCDLKLEVTETTLVDNRSGVAEVLHNLQAIGFTIMMDDFGTGHSSLSGLYSLPIDELKIDQSFIRSTDSNKELIAITSSIMTLAGNLSLDTIGEGIESSNHVTMLIDMGCTFGQGYYFSKPLPADDFESWIEMRRSGRAA